METTVLHVTLTPYFPYVRHQKLFADHHRPM